MKKGRIEIWFNDGEMRCFPNVLMDTIKKDGNMLMFHFGKDPENNPHKAVINFNNVNFVETMEEK